MEDEIIPEMSEGNYEADQARLNIDCEHRHNSFVSKNEFAVNKHPFNHERHTIVKHRYLPNEYNRKDLYELVLTLFPLVVLVRTLGRLKQNASGRIVQVAKRFVTRANGTVFEQITIRIMTAWHVCKYAMSSDANGLEMECVLDYDSKETPGIPLEVSGIYYKDEIRDVCVLECPIFDKAIGRMLSKRVANFDRVFQNVYEKMKRKKRSLESWFTSEWTMSRLVIIISHPHGGPKKISVGEWTWRVPYERENGRHCLSYTYTANTCCGSSGAPVIVFGAPTNNILLCHRGKRAIDGVNCSSKAFRLKKDQHGASFFQVWETA